MRKATVKVTRSAAARITTEARPVGPPAISRPDTKPSAVSPEAVRLRAYQRWDAAGRPAGDGVNFWLEAERELAPAEDPAKQLWHFDGKSTLTLPSQP